MPIHYERRDDHIVVITIDRPEARNSLDLYHFRDLANAWRRFRDDPEDWVAIITGVEGQFMTGADLKTYIPQITELAKQKVQAVVLGCTEIPLMLAEEAEAKDLLSPAALLAEAAVRAAIGDIPLPR